MELGLPLATLIVGLLLWGLWVAVRQAWRTGGELGTARRSAMVMVSMIGLHSLLEYPLWYSYFLLPTAWVWGFALAAQAPPAEAAIETGPSKPLAGALLVVVLAAALSVLDYTRVAAIFNAADGAPPLEQRIAAGRHSVLFAHHADYAAVTSGTAVADPEHAFDRVTHYLLDTRLMTAWSKSLADRGELDAARFVAERLREFHKDDAEDFFAACPTAAPVGASAAAPFQCELPTRAPGWREFAVH